MIYREDVIATARHWLGTPYHHQAKLRGVGCDCGGLVAGVGHDLGLIRTDDKTWKSVANYGRQPNPNQMGKIIKRFLEPMNGDPRPGDVAWIEWRENLPMHLAILAHFDDRPTIIHALGEAGRVVEHDFSQEWRDRVSSWWRYPGVI